MPYSLHAIPTSQYEEQALGYRETVSPELITAITDFYVSDFGTQCAVVLFASGEFDQIPSAEIEVR